MTQDAQRKTNSGDDPMTKRKSHNLTKFQWKVLEVTAKIPIGETRSYKWVAEKTGSPKAFRAVGQVLKKNPYPVTIPCHRVIRQDGSLGGYSGGPGIKKAKLLAAERELKTYLNQRRKGAV
jgi:methylated-DNA-[protein]-cysteine S-methyltransferase